MIFHITADGQNAYEKDCWEIPSFVLKKKHRQPFVMDPDESVDLDEMIRKYAENQFLKTLFRLIDERHLSDPQVYRQAEIDRRYFSKIRNGMIPKKNTIIALALSLRLSTEETEELLMSAGYVLTAFRKTDIIVRWCIRNHIYRIADVNDCLSAHGQPVLR
jgi:predicted transcriptional regulator